MSLELWLGFAVAAAGLIVVPGPTQLLIIGYSVSSGIRPALLSMAGVVLGDVTALSISFLGLGAVLATSAELFLVLKWLGAAYLLYLGVRLWRAPPAPLEADLDAPGLPVLGMVCKACAVTVGS